MARRKRKSLSTPEGFELRYALATERDGSGEPTGVIGIEWHPDGETIACLTEHEIWFGDHSSGILTETHIFEESLMCFAWSPDGDTLAVGTRENILLVDFHSRETLKRMATDRPELFWDVAWSPDGKSLASLSHVVRVWDSQSGQAKRTFRVRRDKAACVAWSPDSQRIAWATGAVHIHFAETGEVWRKLEMDELAGASSVAWSPAGDTLAIGCSLPRRVLLLDPEKRSLVTLDSDDADVATRVQFSPDGRLLAGAFWEQVRIWSLADRRLLATIDATLSFLERKFSFHPTEPALALAAASPQGGDIVQVWSFADSIIPGEPCQPGLSPNADAATEYPVEAKADPVPTGALSPVTRKPVVRAPPTTSIFICYAHADNQPPKRWLDRLLEHLSPLVRQEDLAVWSDQRLKLGDEWDPQIQQQLGVVKVAVLLVSPAFLASKYIANSELPVLLRRASEDGLKILPVLLSPSLFHKTRFRWPDPKTGPQEFTLSNLQAAGAPSETLSEMTEPQQDRVFVALAERILEIIDAVP